MIHSKKKWFLFLHIVLITDPDATYTSFSNPNYFFNRTHHHRRHHNNNNNNNNDSSPVNGNNNSISVEKLSLSSDFFDGNSGAFSDYSSCEPTPTTPDRTLVLQKLHSLSDGEDDDDIEADGDGYGQSADEDKAPLVKNDSDSDESTGSTVEEPRIYYGVGAQQCRRSRGILGYLEMLEKQAMEREMRSVNGANNDGDNGGEEDGDDEDESDSPKTMQGGDQPVEPPRDEK